MKFDRKRNAAELRELLDYLVCIAIGFAVAPLVHASPVLVSFVILLAFTHWKRRGLVLNSRLRTLAILVCFGVLLSVNWDAFCQGVSEGYDAYAAIGKNEMNQAPRSIGPPEAYPLG